MARSFRWAGMASENRACRANAKRRPHTAPDFHPLHTVEFQGKDHHQGTAAARDAVKKETLRRAGIGYVEVVSGDTPAEVREMGRG